MPDKDNENLEDKKSKKRKKKAEPVEIEEGYEQEKLGSKMLLFLVTILIIAISAAAPVVAPSKLSKSTALATSSIVPNIKS